MRAANLLASSTTAPLAAHAFPKDRPSSNHAASSSDSRPADEALEHQTCLVVAVAQLFEIDCSSMKRSNSSVPMATVRGMQIRQLASKLLFEAVAHDHRVNEGDASTFAADRAFAQAHERRLSSRPCCGEKSVIAPWRFCMRASRKTLRPNGLPHILDGRRTRPRDGDASLSAKRSIAARHQPQARSDSPNGMIARSTPTGHVCCELLAPFRRRR
jgi:hypothetical protein